MLSPKIFLLLLLSSQFVMIECYSALTARNWRKKYKTIFLFRKKHSVVFKPDSLSKDIEIKRWTLNSNYIYTHFHACSHAAYLAQQWLCVLQTCCKIRSYMLRRDGGKDHHTKNSIHQKQQCRGLSDLEKKILLCIC